VNGDIVQEPYTDIRIEDGDHGPFVVEEGRYFVMGDNRHQGASLDSRSFGSVASGLIEGRADFILWPMGKAGTL
jgi:signal peptidase I